MDDQIILSNGEKVRTVLLQGRPSIGLIWRPRLIQVHSVTLVMLHKRETYSRVAFTKKLSSMTIRTFIPVLCLARASSRTAC